MRRTMLLLATMALTLLVASGVALALTRIGTDGPDTLRGTNGDDNLIGKGGNDILLSLAGDDTLLGGPGKDVVNGGNLAEPFGGNKNLVGGEGNDAVQGGLGSDNVLGGEGNDFMVDGEFEPPAVRDTLSAEEGNDVLSVANKPAGKDVVSCGSGIDRVLADRADVVTPDCEKVFIGLGSQDAFLESIPDVFCRIRNDESRGDCWNDRRRFCGRGEVSLRVPYGDEQYAHVATVRLRGAYRATLCSVTKVMSSSCSQPSPTKE